MKYGKLRELYGVPSDIELRRYLDLNSSHSGYINTLLVPDSSYGALIVFSGRDAGYICGAYDVTGSYACSGFFIRVDGSYVYRRLYLGSSALNISSNASYNEFVLGANHPTLYTLNFLGSGDSDTFDATTFRRNCVSTTTGTVKLTNKSPGRPIYLFRANSPDVSSYTAPAARRIYVAAFSSGSNRVGVMVPASRGSSVGMYDLARCLFLPLSSTAGSTGYGSVCNGDSVPEYLLYALGYEETSSPSIPCDLRPLG